MRRILSLILNALIAVLPMLLYGLFYVGNIAVNGIGKGAETNDWYGFAARGPKWAAVVFVCMTAAAWLIAAMMRLPRRKRPLQTD